MTSSVTIREVTVRFGRQTSLDHVSLTIGQGTTFGLVGESGSGKTTLIRTVLGLQRAEAGEVLLEGKPLGRGTRGFAERAPIMQAIFQDPAASLSPRRRIGALMAEVSTVLREPQAETQARLSGLLARLGLPDTVLSRYPHEISGGQARRVAIARALLMRPRIIVADEPTAGLDVSVQGDLLNLLQDIRKAEGVTLIVVSHNLAVVRLLADEVAVMKSGRVVETGPVMQIFDQPQQAYTRELLASWPSAEAKIFRRRLHLRDFHMV